MNEWNDRKLSSFAAVREQTIATAQSGFVYDSAFEDADEEQKYMILIPLN